MGPAVVQYASDLFLDERPGTPRLPVAAPVLVLAGNLGNPRSARYGAFLRAARAGRERVFVAMGPAEERAAPHEPRLAAEAARRACEAAGAELLDAFCPASHGAIAFVGGSLPLDAARLLAALEAAGRPAVVVSHRGPEEGGGPDAARALAHPATAAWICGGELAGARAVAATASAAVVARNPLGGPWVRRNGWDPRATLALDPD